MRAEALNLRRAALSNALAAASSSSNVSYVMLHIHLASLLLPTTALTPTYLEMRCCAITLPAGSRVLEKMDFGPKVRFVCGRRFTG